MSSIEQRQERVARLRGLLDQINDCIDLYPHPLTKAPDDLAAGITAWELQVMRSRASEVLVYECRVIESMELLGDDESCPGME